MLNQISGLRQTAMVVVFAAGCFFLLYLLWPFGNTDVSWKILPENRSPVTSSTSFIPLDSEPSATSSHASNSHATKTSAPPASIQSGTSQKIADPLTPTASTGDFQDQDREKARMAQVRIQQQQLILHQRQQQALNSRYLGQSIEAINAQIANETNPARKSVLFQARQQRYKELREKMRNK